MDPNEVFEYVTEGMKWLAIGGGSYMGALIGCQISDVWPFHKKIKSQEELELVVEKEAKKLGLDPTRIDAKYKGDGDFARKNGDRHDIHLAGDWQSTRNSVRHELYHILKRDTEHTSALKYLFIQEPRATLYGTFGIKL